MKRNIRGVNSFMIRRTREIISTENLILLIYFLPIFNYYLSGILALYNIEPLSMYIITLAYFIAFYSYIRIIRSKPYQSLLVIISFSIIFLMVYLINESAALYFFNNSFETSNFIFFWGLCLPIFLLFLKNINFSIFLNIAHYYSLLILLLNVISFVLQVFVFKIMHLDYMTFAYSALVPIFICVYWNNEHHNIISTVLVIVASSFVAIGGSRGALLTLLVFYVLYFLFLFKFSSKYFFLQKILIFSSLLICILNVNNIFYFLDNTLEKFGYNSRIFSIFIDQKFYESSGRDFIMSRLVREINLLGHGLYADRVMVGTYAHNWMLELIINFGLILGILIIFIVVVFLVRALGKSIKFKRDDLKFLIVCTISILFVKFQISGSYLTSSEFWLFIGIAINISYIKFDYFKESRRRVILWR